MSETSVVFRKLNLKNQTEIAIVNSPVAVDEDWSAVRFRRVDFIKALTRGKEHTISAAGKAKAGARAKSAPKASLEPRSKPPAKAARKTARKTTRKATNGARKKK